MGPARLAVTAAALATVALTATWINGRARWNDREHAAQQIADLTRQVADARAEVESVRGLAHEHARNQALATRATEVPWTASTDGRMSIRAVVDADEYLLAARAPVRALVEVRNASAGPLEVTPPHPMLLPLTVFGPGGELPERGPTKCLFPRGPVVLPPGRVVRVFVDLPPAGHAGLDKPGDFRLQIGYESRAAFAGWKGTVGPVEVRWSQR